MGARYDHDLIRRLMEESADPVNDLEAMHAEYNTKYGEEAISKRALRKVIYDHYRQWYGVPIPEAKRGRPPKYDEKYIIQLRNSNPSVGITTLARMYNCGRTDYLPVGSLSHILLKYYGRG